jgi:hypothetical protein
MRSRRPFTTATSVSGKPKGVQTTKFSTIGEKRTGVPVKMDNTRAGASSTANMCAEVAGVNSSGITALTLPAAMLQLGKKTELSVVAPQTGNRHWFGLYEYP